MWQNSSLSITQADHQPPKKSIPNGSSAAMPTSHSMDYMNHAPPLKALSRERQELTIGAKSEVKSIQNNINEGKILNNISSFLVMASQYLTYEHNISYES